MSRIFAPCVFDTGMILGFAMLIYVDFIMRTPLRFDLFHQIAEGKSVVSKKGTQTSLLNGFLTWIYFKHHGTCHPCATVFSKLRTMIMETHIGFKPVTVTVTIYHFWIFWAVGLEFMQTLTLYFHVHGSLWRYLFSMFLLSGAICGRRSETVTHFT